MTEKIEKYSGFRKWFIVNIPKKSVEYLKEAEIIKLFEACKTNEDRYLIAVLFDSGFRASEFLNIRFQDIQEPTQAFPYYKFEVKTEYSKTEGRNIGLYWKHSQKAIKDYLSELDNKNPKAPVFKKTYDSIRLFLTRLGLRVLNKRIYFHIFRKSSASYYASIIKNRQQMCYRYGWKFSSDVPDVYITRELGDDIVKDDVTDINYQKVEKENEELKTKFGIQEDRMDKMENLFTELINQSISKAKQKGNFISLKDESGKELTPQMIAKKIIS